MKERSLVFFTLAMQTAVGMFISLTIVYRWLAGESGSGHADAMVDTPLLTVGLLVGLGTLASVTHLGSPLNAWRALSNLGSSWLSREILFASLFAVTGGLYALLHWLDIGAANERIIVAGLAGVSGVLLVYSMARVYTLRTIPAWKGIRTPVSFFATTIVLGNLAALIAMVYEWKWFQSHPGLFRTPTSIFFFTIDWVMKGVIVILCIKLMLQAIEFTPLSHKNEHKSNWPLLILTTGATLAAIMLLYVSNNNNLSSLKHMEAAVWLSFLLALAAETVGRFQFYQVQKQREL